MLTIRESLQLYRYIQTQSQGIAKIAHASGNKKQAGVALVKSHKTDFKLKLGKQSMKVIM